MKTAHPQSLPPGVSGSGGISRSTKASTAAPSSGVKNTHGPGLTAWGGSPANGRQGIPVPPAKVRASATRVISSNALEASNARRLSTAILPVMADAQDAAIDRIEAIERQMRGVQSELQRLKHELGEAKRQLRQSQSEAQRAQAEAREAKERARQDSGKAAAAEPQTTQAVPPTLPSPASGGGLGSRLQQVQAPAAAPPTAAVVSEAVKVGMPDGRPTIATADGRLSLAIGGFMQFDLGGYFQNPNPNTQFPRLNDGVNLRRGRLYFVGKFDDFRVNITPDFGGSPDGSPTLFEANINYTGVKPVTATVGHFHPFLSLDAPTFPANDLFLHPSSLLTFHRT